MFSSTPLIIETFCYALAALSETQGDSFTGFSKINHKHLTITTTSKMVACLLFVLFCLLLLITALILHAVKSNQPWGLYWWEVSWKPPGEIQEASWSGSSWHEGVMASLQLLSGCQTMEETHSSWLYWGFLSFTKHPKLVPIGQDWNLDRLINYHKSLVERQQYCWHHSNLPVHLTL